MNRRRTAPPSDDGAALVADALAANRAYTDELKRAIASLSEEEAALLASVQSLKQRLAGRRTERALAALGCEPAADQEATNGDEAINVFEREVESRYKRVGVVPRSYIRPKTSFFNSPPRKPTSSERDEARRLKRRKTSRQSVADASVPDLASLSEPVPNADTVFLRQQSHEAFLATPAKLFTPKERELVRKVATETLGEDLTQEIPLETWNTIIKAVKPPIHRSGFACKLQWELVDNPTLRLCAWTKEEDRALTQLASGSIDPIIVNDWAAIARRMPMPGRPPVHCLTRYMTKLSPSHLNDKFTAEEDAMLRRAVEVFGERWTIIADLMDGRIAEQLRHRWQMSLSPDIRQGKFTIVEDRRMLLALYAYYDRDQAFHRDSVQWHQICHHLPGRMAPPVRDRFVDSLNPEVTFRDWTADEDAIIRSSVQNQGFDAPTLWPRLAAQLGNRTDNQVARRARTLLPEEYKRHQETSKATTGVVPAIFQRPLAYTKRKSYNPDDDLDTEPVVSEYGMLV